MRARDWMTADPTTAAPDDTVREARHRMRLRGVRHLPVVDGARVVGMLSDRDVRITDEELGQISTADDVARATGAERPVSEVMSSPVYTVDEAASIQDVARLMLSRRISAVPMVTGDGDLAGIITTTDCLLASLSPDAERERGA
jgi:acetoin utilization protein AcuB